MAAAKVVARHIQCRAEVQFLSPIVSPFIGDALMQESLWPQVRQRSVEGARPPPLSS